MTLPAGSVLLDVQGAQNRAHFDRGIPRYMVEQLRAVLAAAPDVVSEVTLNPARPLSGNLLWLLGSELATWQGRGQRPARRPAIFHAMSPFELDRSLEELWPPWARSRDVRTVVTLYDLIPLVFRDHYLRDPVGRSHYQARSELVRGADHILAISRSTADDAIELLGVAPERITVIDAGASTRFAETYEDDAPAWRVLRRRLPELRPGFMLYVSGVEFRKNNERTIRAYARMPEAVRAEHQLVIACSMAADVREAYQSLGRDHGLAPGQLVLPGYVTDGELAALYRLCRLFVFASFYEGSGLPILEAMACGAPVAASSGSTTPEILGDERATFDPFDERDIAATLARVVRDDGELTALKERSARRVGAYTWERVAERTLEGYAAALRPDGRSRRVTRPRVAWVSPWPPERSGVANYTYKLVRELGHGVDVDVVVGHPMDHYAEPLEEGVRLLRASDLDWARDLRGYDAIVYSMGNSSFHEHVYESMMARPGVVLAHDVRLVGFYGVHAGVEAPEDPAGRLGQRLETAYGARIAPGEFRRRPPSPEEQTALGLFLSQEMQRQAEQLIVHSRFAADILRLDRPHERRDHAPIAVLPHAMEPRPYAAGRPFDAEAPLIVSFGVLSVVKGLASLIDAFAIVAAGRPAARLVLAGPGDDAERHRWLRYAAEAGVEGQVHSTGFIGGEEYEQLLASATLAVQLRTITNGEASGAICDCLGAGIPTVATDLGWVAELPPHVIERVPAEATPAVVAAAVERLLDDPGEARDLGARAHEHARATTYAGVAARYLELLGLAAVRR